MVYNSSPQRLPQQPGLQKQPALSPDTEWKGDNCSLTPANFTSHIVTSPGSVQSEERQSASRKCNLR
eukprot:3907208-Amphidinium_carterae.1